MASIGNVTSMQVKSSDSAETNYTTTITSKNAMANPNATYSQVDSFVRALFSLSNNTYQDTTLITAISLEEKLAEEE